MGLPLLFFILTLLATGGLTMPKFSLLFILIIMSQLAFAEHFKDTVDSIDFGENNQEHILKFTNGRAAFLPNHALDSLKENESLIGQYLEIETDEDNTVIFLDTLPLEEAPKTDLPKMSKIPEKMVPTVIPNWNVALKIWQGMNRSYKQVTECTDRAHVWAYEEWKKNDLYSQKSFLFFTNTYIRAYRYNWWFHVSPYALIRENGQDVEHIFDRRYASIPRHLKDRKSVV